MTRHDRDPMTATTRRTAPAGPGHACDHRPGGGIAGEVLAPLAFEQQGADATEISHAKPPGRR